MFGRRDASVALVTGSGSGIGRSTAVRLAGDGWKVAAVDIDARAVAATVASIQELGGVALGVSADVAVSADCARAVDEAGALGSLCAVVNVAGVMVAEDTIETLDDDALERLLAVNVMSVFRLGRYAIPGIRGSGGGVIVNISSVHSFASMGGCAAYAASKGAIVALTRQMAIDLASSGIRVVAVAPGAVDTPLTARELTRRGLTAEETFGTSQSQLGRLVAPEEVASVVAWLVSDCASAVNGQTVIADAGLLTTFVR